MHISSIRYTIIIPIHNISTRSNIQMSLEAHNSHSRRAKVYKRKKSKANTRRGAKQYQYNLPKHPRHEQHMRSVWRLVADSNNMCIRAVGISTPAMQCDRRAVRKVLKRGWGVNSHMRISLVISLDTRGTVRVGGGGAVRASMAGTWRVCLVVGMLRT